jgi:hypothetical protein
MRNLLLIFNFSIFILGGYCQPMINFDDSVNLFRIRIDTTNPENNWHIGTPQKNIFSSAYSIPNAIVTDTANPYPVNNPSIFYLGSGGDIMLDYHWALLNFKYKVDCDSLNDYGRIEISQDTGKTWTNILKGGYWEIKDSTGNMINSFYTNDTLAFTGTTNGWYNFSSYFNLPPYFCDTLIYKFSFNSDNVVENRDGWLIDNIVFFDDAESINENRIPHSAYPNPFNSSITITSKKTFRNIEIINILGKTLKDEPSFSNRLTLDLSNLNAGIYFYSIIFENGYREGGTIIKEQ